MMSRRTAAGRTTIALASVAIIAVAAIGALIVTTRSSQDTLLNPTSTQSTTSDAPTDSTPDTTTDSTNSTICIIYVEGAGTYLRIVSDSTQQPLPGVSVSVLPTASSCFGASRPGPATYTTNATGWVALGGMQANYYFDVSVRDAGRGYNFSLPQGPLDTTNATLSLPSGSLAITLCYTMATANPCRPYTESTTTNTATVTSTATDVVTTTVTSTATTSGPANVTRTVTQTVTTTSTATLSGASSIAAVTVANITIPGGTSGGIAADPFTGMIYVAGPSGVTVIDGLADQIVASVPIHGGSSYLAVDPQTGLVYLNNDSCGDVCAQSLLVLNGTSNRLIGRIDLGELVYWIAVNPNTDMVYAGIRNSLFVVNGSTDSLIGTVSIPGFMSGVAVDPDTDRVYVPACTLQGLVCTPSYIYVIDGATQSVVSKIPGPTGTIAIDPLTDTIYVVADNHLVSINGTSETENYMRLSAFAIQCSYIAVDPEEDNVYVSCTSAQGTSSLFIVDESDNRVVNSFTDTGSLTGIAFDSFDFGTPFLVNQGHVLALFSTYYRPA